MKVIITIGTPHSGHREVADILGQAGVASAKAGSKSSLDPQALQAKLLRSHEVDLSANAPLAQVQPGKLWNELATDLFLTNMHHPTWGWADPQSAVLMDFWHDFDAQVRILLVYNSPANYLEQVLGPDTPPTAQAVSAVLDDWARWNTAMLRYMHRHPDYCVLVSSQQAAAQPQTLVDTLASHWQISGLDSSATSPADIPAYQRLQTHFINQLIDPQHPAMSLFQELEGAALIPAMTDPGADVASNPSANWADWAKLQANLAKLALENSKLTASYADTEKTRSELSKQLEQHATQLDLAVKSQEAANQTKEQQAKLVADLQLAVTALQTQKDQLTKEKATLTHAKDTETKAKADALAQRDLAAKDKTTLTQQHHALQAEKVKLNQQLEQLKTQLAQATQASQESAELKQENELLLLQLHQVQEELESHFLKNQALSETAEQAVQLKKDLASLQTLRDSLTKEKAELIKGRDAQAKLLQERQTQLDLAAKAQEAANKAKDQQAKQLADLQLAMTALQAQKELSAKDKAALTQQLEQHKTQLAQANQAGLQSAELKQENELLLLQLHQVQEELESHILKNQALSETAEQAVQLKKDLASLQTLRDSLAKEKAELIKGRDAQAKLLQESQTQLDLAAKAQEAANKAKDQQAKQLADLQLAMTALQTQKELSAKDKAALTQQLEQHKTQLAQATKASAQASQASLESAELKQENELLLRQLHQVQEELEHYFFRHQELEKSQNSKAASFVSDFWRMHQPQEIVISMQQDIAGSNWYPAESDGRWAGPATLSTVQIPPVQPGNYTLELDIVDAMNLGIVNELVVEALGQTLPVEVVYPIYKDEYPLIGRVSFTVSSDASQQSWPLNLRFSQTVSPADNGSDDMRNLTVRLRTLKLVKLA
jgi:hypothetical protein